MANDDVQRALGRIEATLDSHTGMLSKLNTDVEKMDDKLIVAAGKAEKAIDRLNAIEPALVLAAAHGKDWNDTKKTALWIAALGIGGGTVGGAALSNFIEKLFGP